MHLLGQTEDLRPSVVTLSMAFPEKQKEESFKNSSCLCNQINYNWKSSSKFDPKLITPSDLSEESVGVFLTGTHYSTANERAIHQSVASHEQARSRTVLEMGLLWQLPLLLSSIIRDNSLQEGFRLCVRISCWMDIPVEAFLTSVLFILWLRVWMLSQVVFIWKCLTASHWSS